FWAVVDRIGQVIGAIAADPLAFGRNLLAALKQGFAGFFDHFGRHLLEGFLGWLFSGLGDVGVQLPGDFSLGSIITLFLQIMGITWARIRRLLVVHVGERNMALVEQAAQLIATLIAQGPRGIFELIKDRLDPRALIDMVIQGAVDYLIEVLVTRVAARILMLFNPVGAILQAIEAIYRVLKWVFENAARIFRLVETVVSGAADLVAGNVGGLAGAIETALAGLITPVIGFLADYLGLGGLPRRIADFIGALQARVERILERV
ncbi:MAG: hypothetical protein KC620_26505, partial [Myxococcales bacterium]|nr:hypothetical protein [Myxococcales bacterium]